MEYFVENAFSGARLRIYREIPTSEPKAVVHITHGMAEHAGRYSWFMDVLKRAGYAVYAHDIRGHGYTYAYNSSKGHFCDKNGLDKILHDLDFSIDLIKKKSSKYPYLLFWSLTRLDSFIKICDKFIPQDKWYSVLE